MYFCNTPSHAPAHINTCILASTCDGSDTTYGIDTSEFDRTVVTLDSGTPWNESISYTVQDWFIMDHVKAHLVM